MKIFFQTIAVAFGMFSAVPIPQPKWNEKNMRFMMCAFPLVGVCIGVICAMWYKMSFILNLPNILRGAGFCLIPVAVTGGIHLDGYADTSDALSSFGSKEKKLEILSDPHCGAFAVIRLISYMICYFALCSTIKFSVKIILCWGMSFVMSRILSGLAVASFTMAKNTGLAHTFASTADKMLVRVILLVFEFVTAATMIIIGKIYAAAMIIAGLLTFLRYYTVSIKHFGGISGDLAGWFLQKAELWMLASAVAVQIAEGII